MSCSCVKVSDRGLRIKWREGRDGTKGLTFLFLASCSETLPSAHLLKVMRGKCVHSNTWTQIHGERAVSQCFHAGWWGMAMSPVMCFLLESLLGHFLEKRMSCENLTWLVEQGAWQMLQPTKCCSRGWGNVTVGEVLVMWIWGPESGFLEPRVGKLGAGACTCNPIAGKMETGGFWSCWLVSLANLANSESSRFSEIPCIKTNKENNWER